ncbi:syndecan-4-like isoform X3 [Acipenser ruthenus]|uniref:syndecan-4-like isoform X3 n=1 Tax=Acipenser ruthenus TaxID=7906 RepID=UPI0027422F43|nr:syndecan-4-like isoform X3 [Acipenser ruthenus]
MQKLCALLVLFFLASVYTESQVRETETWVPSDQKSGEDVDVSSGDFPNSSDFGFMNKDELDTYDDEDDEDDEDYEVSGSGDEDDDEEEEEEVVIENPKDYNDVVSKSQPDLNSNRIPEDERTVSKKNEVDEKELVSQNEVGVRSKAPRDDVDTNVLMASTSNESMFQRTEVLAALIAGGAVGLVFAVLLVLLLIYRMKKKDEGSYELAKKPIYTKAPTAEIYA